MRGATPPDDAPLKKRALQDPRNRDPGARLAAADAARRSTGTSSARPRAGTRRCSSPSLAVALLDTVIPLFIGRLVALMEATDRAGGARARAGRCSSAMVALVLLVRPLALLADIAIRHNALDARRDRA